MIRSVAQIVAQHKWKLRQNAVRFDAYEAAELANQQPVRVTKKKKQDGGTTTNRYFAGE